MNIKVLNANQKQCKLDPDESDCHGLPNQSTTRKGGYYE